jgi:hypothetical protein
MPKEIECPKCNGYFIPNRDDVLDNDGYTCSVKCTLCAERFTIDSDYFGGSFYEQTPTQ